MSRLRLAVWFVVVGFVVLPVVASAASSNSGGFAVSPAFDEVSVPSGQTSVVTSIALSNQTAQVQQFALSTVDFGALNEDGGVAFLGAQASELTRPYGLAAWLQLPETTITVNPDSEVALKVTIVNRPDLAPGGHYGAVLATALTTTGNTKAGHDSVGVKPVLSSLLLVTKEGGLRQNLALVGQTSNAGWWRLPSEVMQRFRNVGNVHLVPRGVVAVQDPHGAVVARATINDGSGIILPGTYRRYTVAPLLAVGRAWLPGRYRLVATYSFQGSEQIQTFTQSFWYVGALVIWVVALLALVAVAGLVWWLWVRPRLWKRPRDRR